MASHWGPPGPKSVGEFQISTTPWVTSSILLNGETLQVSFPSVTSFVVIRNANTGSSPATVMAVGFTENGVMANPAAQTNYIKLGGGESLSANLRIKDLWLSNSDGSDNTWIEYEVLAGLTDIPRSQFLKITGSDGYKAIG